MKQLIILITLYFILYTSPTSAFAAPAETEPASDPPILLQIGTYKVLSPIKYTDIGSIVSALLPYIFVIAGLILFGLLIVNGLKFLTSGGNPKSTEGAKSGLTAALVGFIIIFVSFWIIQLLQVVLQINILGQ